jgi:hypothetical protein
VRRLRGARPARRHRRAEERDVVEDVPRIVKLCRHFERILGGKVVQAFHERRSELVHIDVHLIPPAPSHPFITLFTTGMSARPMRGGCEHHQPRAELMMTLPPDWRLPEPSCRHKDTPVQRCGKNDKRWMWPVFELQSLARMPHARGTWLARGHTVEIRGSLPGFSTRFGGFVLTAPILAPLDPATGPDGDHIDILALVPLHREELALKLQDPDKLFDRLIERGITEAVDLERPSVVSPADFAPSLLRRR